MSEWLDSLATRRAVLCLPANREVIAWLGERGVSTAALDGDLEPLRHHRHKFDCAYVDRDALPAVDQGTLEDLLSNAIAPGGLIVEHRGGRHEMRQLRPRPAAPAPGLVVGPYADLFVGCRLVAELGAGRAAFLDAVRIRDVACFGVETDRALAAAACGRGHEVRVGGLAELVAQRERGIDGIFVGNVIETVPNAQLPALLRACRAALQPGGRLVIRARHEFLTELLPRVEAASWGRCVASRVDRDPRDAAALLIAGAAAHAVPADLPSLALPTADLTINQPPRSWFDLERFERRDTSQCGEDGILAALFARLGTTDRFYVEFGCGDGVQCNTRALQAQGWHGVLMDGTCAPGAADVEIHAHWITAENINELLDRHGVPAEPDLMSIDLDGNDYWVWRAITRRPRVVIAEYNGNLAADVALTIAYDPQHNWDGSDYYGASLLALGGLAREKGYTLVYCTQAGVNAFFVRDDLLGDDTPPDPQSIYRPANYWYRGGRSRPDLSRTMVRCRG